MGIPCAGSSPVFGRDYLLITRIMIKKIIFPFQSVLLQKRLCVGCTAPLDKAKRLGKISERRELVECKCKRRYIYNKELNEYERASFQEEQQFLKDLSKKNFPKLPQDPK